MVFWYLMWLCLCTSVVVRGQAPELEQAVYGTGPFLSTDQSQWSLFRNPAGLVETDSWNGLIAYYLPYGLPDLQSLSWGLLVPIKPVLGISVFQSGSRLFRSQQIAISTAFGLGQVVLGARIKYWRLVFAGNEPVTAASLELGLQFKLSDKLVAGTFLSNVLQSKVANEQTLPVVWAAGVRYQSSTKVLFLLETGHRLGEILELKLGGQYQMKEKIALRTGYSTYSRQSYFGLTFSTPNLELDYAISLHFILGVVHQGGISISWP